VNIEEHWTGQSSKAELMQSQDIGQYAFREPYSEVG